MESIPLDFTETAEVENKKYGEKFEYDAAGPYQKTRTRTDFCWLIGFIGFLVLWSIIIIYAFSTGDTSKWLKPKDSTGRICGYDSDVEDKPYLVKYYSKNDCFGIDCQAVFVCQTECPKNDFNFEEYPKRLKRNTNATVTSKETDVKNNGTSIQEVPKLTKNETQTTNQTSTLDKLEKPTNKLEDNANKNATNSSNTNSTISTTARTPSSTEEPSASKTARFEKMMKNVICLNDINIKLIKSWAELKYLVDNGQCSNKYSKTHEVYGYLCGFNSTTNYDDYDSSDVHIITRDLSNTKYSIIGFVLLSGLIALTSIFLMRWYALAYVCISIFVICAVAFHYIYERCVTTAESKTNGVLLALFLGVVVLVLIVLIAIYYRQQLSLACQMIKESSKAITCVLSTLAVPFVFFVIYMIIFILGISAYYLLSTLESPVYKVDFADNLIEICQCPSNLGYEEESVCDPQTFNSQCRKPSGEACVLSGCYMTGQVRRDVGFLHFMNFIGLVWIFWFITGFNDTVLASVFSTWYWTFNKKILTYLSVIESFWRISTYHLGTIALGSLLLLMCTVTREIIKAIERGLRKSNKPCAAVIQLSLQGVFNFMERCINFINRRAYIMCAMHGSDFLQSARMAYYLLKRNVARVVAVVTVTNCLTLITTILIACITTRISISYYDTYPKEELTYRGTIALFVFLGSYGLCRLLMRVIEIAVDTVFICFLEDTERNDGSNDKPYFMSDELTKFLFKK